MPPIVRWGRSLTVSMEGVLRCPPVFRRSGSAARRAVGVNGVDLWTERHGRLAREVHLGDDLQVAHSTPQGSDSRHPILFPSQVTAQASDHKNGLRNGRGPAVPWDRLLMDVDPESVPFVFTEQRGAGRPWPRGPSRRVAMLKDGTDTPIPMVYMGNRQRTSA